MGELAHGVRQVAPMLNVTRTWNVVCAVANMACAIRLTRDYAIRRRAFGRPLIEQPLHAQTLAGDGLAALRAASADWLDGNDDMHAASAIRQSLDAAARWLDQHAVARDSLEAGARGLVFTLARCAAAALLVRQASSSSAHGAARPAAALHRFVQRGLDRLVTPDADNTALLLGWRCFHRPPPVTCPHGLKCRDFLHGPPPCSI